MAASNLNTPMEVQTSAVMPKGISNLRLREIFANGNSSFNEKGHGAPLSDPFYKEIRWRDFIDQKTDSEDTSLLFGYLDAKKVNMNEVVGTTTGDIHVAARPIVPIFIHGITDKLTLVLAVPVIRYKVNAQTGFLYGSSLKKIYEELEKDQKFHELNELSSKMANPIASKLDEYGFAPIRNKEGSFLGDVALAAKYLSYKKDDLSLSSQFTLTVPSGKRKSEDDLIAIGSDHLWATGLTLITDYRLNTWLGLAGAAAYTYKVPDTVEKRVPYRQDSKITPDKDARVKRKMGDEILTQVAVKFYPIDELILSFGYSFQYKNADRYSGAQYAPERYQWMSGQSIERLDTITAGLSLNTIYLFLQKKFPLPLEMAFNHSIAIRGKNANRDSLSVFDLSLFF